MTSDPTILSTRDFAAPPAALFAAFADPARLAQWWGPAGFTNAITRFEFRVGGAWHVTMRAPDGTAFDNVSHFTVLSPAERIVFVHDLPMHRFEMDMTFAPLGPGTRLTWRMTFDDPGEVQRLGTFIVAANEQNFDRLQAHLAATV